MKIVWEDIVLIFSFSALFIILLLILLRKRCSKPTTPADMVTTDAEESDEFPHQNDDKSKASFFCWSDHPSLLANAVENGWPPFSFAPCPSLTPAASSHSGFRGKESNHVVISWEVFDESAEYMQKMRVRRRSIKNFDSALSVIRAALPLPGPQFANAAFPKEAYFEITILPEDQEQAEARTRKLIGEDFDGRKSFEYNKIEQVRIGGGENEIVLVGIGLTGGGRLPLKFPGSFPGSVGFNSTGSLYLDGMKLAHESTSAGWGRGGDVIGCGYHPAYKKVFFTLNSKLINEVRCKTEEYGHPLYPMIAASTDVTVVVNLGQSPFRYEAANSHRTPNPCFVTIPTTSSNAAARYELDSKELFSMGRIDGKWKQWPAKKSSESIHLDTDQVSEPDLFEIAVK